jgi:hypothetical protein
LSPDLHLAARYGDVHPVGGKEKVLGMLVMVLGPFLAGYITSSISTVMNIRNTTSAHVAAKKQVRQRCGHGHTQSRRKGWQTQL